MKAFITICFIILIYLLGLEIKDAISQFAKEVQTVTSPVMIHGGN